MIRLATIKGNSNTSIAIPE